MSGNDLELYSSFGLPNMLSLRWPHGFRDIHGPDLDIDFSLPEHDLGLTLSFRADLLTFSPMVHGKPVTRHTGVRPFTAAAAE